MRKKFFQTMLFVALVLVVTFVLSAVGSSVDGAQRSRSQDNNYAGTWTGSYNSEAGGTGTVSYTLSKDAKGQWHGTVKYGNQDGEQTAELMGLRIANGKMAAKIESGDGDAEVTIEGTFHPDKLEGTYTVVPKGATEPVDKGTWSATKASPTKM